MQYRSVHLENIYVVNSAAHQQIEKGPVLPPPLLSGRCAKYHTFCADTITISRNHKTGKLDSKDSQTVFGCNKIGRFGGTLKLEDVGGVCSTQLILNKVI